VNANSSAYAWLEADGGTLLLNEIADIDGLGPRASFRASMTVTSAPLRRPPDDRCVRNIILPGSGRNDSLVRVI
jgi:hypothetical protein